MGSGIPNANRSLWLAFDLPGIDDADVMNMEKCGLWYSNMKEKISVYLDYLLSRRD